MEKLSGKQARYLRGLGHHLKPVVMVGKDEINEAVIEATSEALAAHELIKVKLQEGCLSDRNEVAAQLSAATQSRVAQIMGNTILLYRQGNEPTIVLP
ncbi:MAG: ribosome assembly RNA-binding protein YhbY [Desulfuromonas sp.]|nr:MAG: ribosome assembly RNA-binding protein YhbY [Desulfuromonas sp.]